MNPSSASGDVRAAVFNSPGESIVLRSFQRPILADDEVLVRVICCTLCGSDLHTYQGKRRAPTPSILGHEVLGEIVAFGPAHSRRDWRGTALEIGDRVSWCVAASCCACYFCQHELPQKCERLFKYGHESCCGNHALSGGLAEMCHLASGTAIVRVPPNIPDAVASTANCAIATVAAAIRAAGGCSGRTVLVQGCGLLGLTATALASVAGVANIIVTDVDADRLATARQFGATHTFDVQRQSHELREQVDQLTSGRGVDVAFEMSGAADAMPTGLSLLRTGGRYILVGAVKPIGTIPLDVEQVVRRMWRIEGVHNFAPDDLATAIDFLAAHHDHFPFAVQVAGEFTLDEVDVAFQHMIATKAIRVALRPNGRAV